MSPDTTHPEPVPATPLRPSERSIPLWRALVVLALGAATAWVVRQGAEINTTNEAGVIPELPAVVGGYTGAIAEVSEGERELLPLDTVFAKRSYTSFFGDELSCQIVLSGGEKRSIHRPEICLPGQGWSIQGGSPLAVPLADGRQFRVMHLTLARPIQVGPEETKTLNSHFLYWFVGRDRVTPLHYERVMLTSWDRVFHNTNHRWAYVIVSSPVWKGFRPAGKDSDATLSMLKEFVRDLAPYIHKPEVLAKATK